MNWPIFFFGTALGWLLGMLIDWWYWRDRRICTDAEQELQMALSRAQTDNNNLTTQLSDYRIRGEQLEEAESRLLTREAELSDLGLALSEREQSVSVLSAELESRHTHLAQLETDFQNRESDLRSREIELDTRFGNLDARDAELASLSALLAAKEANLSNASVDYQSQEARLADWEARLSAREAELNQRNTDLELRLRDVTVREAQLPVAGAAAVGGFALGAMAGGGDASPTLAVNEFAGDVHAGMLTIAGTSEPDSTVEVFIDDSPHGIVSADSNGAWSLRTTIHEPGRYDIYANWLDNDGNIIATSDNYRLALLPPDPDDLKVVWGIGPKIEQILNASGIYTFSQLADTPLEILDNILRAAGDRFVLAKQQTWAQQARLAAQGEWDELKRVKDEQDWGGDRRLI